jgi:hypothetical protein
MMVHRGCIGGMEGGTPEAPVAVALWAHHVVAHPVLARPKATLRATADPIVAMVGKGRGDEGLRQRVCLGVVSSPLSVFLAGDPGVLRADEICLLAAHPTAPVVVAEHAPAAELGLVVLQREAPAVGHRAWA